MADMGADRVDQPVGSHLFGPGHVDVDAQRHLWLADDLRHAAAMIGAEGFERADPLRHYA